MTYCADLLVKGGLPMVVDVQPNIALDNIATFRGLHLFGRSCASAMAMRYAPAARPRSPLWQDVEVA